MEFLEEFQNPPEKYRIKPFWFWNGEMTKEEISRQIEEMADKGLGGVFICARQGMTLPYLSKSWFEMVEYACEEAKKHGLEVWLYDEYPYPSGMSGGEVLLEHPEAEHKVLKHKTIYADGGQTVREELGWSRILHAKAYRVTGGTHDGDCGKTDWEGCDTVDLRDWIGNLQTEKIYQKTGLTKYNNKRFFSYGPKKILECVLPEGRWRIEVYMEEALGDFKYYGGFFDPCSREAVATFIETTHERYRKASGSRFGDSIHGMFSDEVGLLGGIPWSGLLPERFEEKNGYSLLECLPALHDSSVPEAARIRYDLYRTVHELFVESYHRQVAEWCKKNRLSYATEVPSMRLGTQRYSDIIGGDTAHEKLGKPLEWIYDEYIRNYRSNAKAVSSLARQLDREYAMIESFHSVGWTMTLQDAKWMIDRLGSSGINLYNFHAFYYTIADITKHDAPPSQFLQNPYWKHYRKLADYVGRMGVMVSNTEADIQIAVLDPAAALWTKLGNPFQGFPYAGESKTEQEACDRLRDSWVHVCKTLLFHQLDYEHLDGEMLAEASVEDGKIRLGRAAYSVVVLPPCHVMERDAREKLEELVRQGGRVIAAGMIPEVSIDREESDGETKEAWERLFGMKGTYRLEMEQGQDEDELVRLCREQIRPAAQIEVVYGNRKDVIGCVRVGRTGATYVFVANQGAGEVRVRITATSRADHSTDRFTAKICSLEDGSMALTETEAGTVTVSLGGFESRWVRLSYGEEVPGKEKAVKKDFTKAAPGIPMNGEWSVRIKGENICRFDTAEMSLDRTVWRTVEVKTFIEQCDETKLLGAEQVDFTGMFGTPKKLTPSYPAECCYRVGFEIASLPGRLSLLMDRETVAGDHEIRVNGTVIAKEAWRSVWVNDQNNRAADILGLVRAGKNEIEITVQIMQDEDGLRDPIYLWGNFGVGKKDGSMILTKMPEYTEPDRPWYRGFPFYSGEISFEKVFELEELTGENETGALPEEIPLRLKFSKPVYDCIEVEMNGNPLGVKAYTPYEWMCRRRFLKDGKNRVTVRITNTLANMLDGTYFDYDRHCLVKIEPQPCSDGSKSETDWP